MVALFEHLARASIRYPNGVVPVGVGGPPPITGTAFFPGGYGLWRPDPDLPPERSPRPLGGVMWVANNFGSEAYVERRLRRRAEVTIVNGLRGSTTWRQLLPLIADAGVTKEASFFTNAYMGLLEGAQSNLTRFPGTEPGGAFDNDCQAFMLEQVAAMKPKLIIALGTPSRRFLGRVGGDDLWASSAGFAELDRRDGSLTTLQIGSRRAAGLALMHPSYRQVNLRRHPRLYKGKPVPDAETHLLVEALSRTGFKAPVRT